MSIDPQIGLPGVGADTPQNFPNKILFQDAGSAKLAGTNTLKGASCADPNNTSGYDGFLRSGLPIGPLTAGGLGVSIIGQMTASSEASATEIVISPAQAVELVRRVGATGTFNLTGAPTAAGVVATEQVTYTAVDTSTGAVTCSAITAAFHVDSWVMPEDGSEAMDYVLYTQDGIRVVDEKWERMDTEASLLATGIVDADKLIFWPTTQTSLATYYKTQLSRYTFA